MSPFAQSFQVRPAHLEERAALEAIQMRASLASPGDAAFVRASPQVIELPEPQIANERVLVAEYEGCPAGFAVLLAAAPGTAELDGLFVEPHLWRRGIGTRLLEACKVKALSEGASCIAVVANTHALKFYSARGFVSTGTVKTQFSEAHRMTLTLSAAEPSRPSTVQPGR